MSKRVKRTDAEKFRDRSYLGNGQPKTAQVAHYQPPQGFRLSSETESAVTPHCVKPATVQTMSALKALLIILLVRSTSPWQPFMSVTL